MESLLIEVRTKLIRLLSLCKAFFIYFLSVMIASFIISVTAANVHSLYIARKPKCMYLSNHTSHVNDTTLTLA